MKSRARFVDNGETNSEKWCFNTSRKNGSQTTAKKLWFLLTHNVIITIAPRKNFFMFLRVFVMWMKTFHIFVRFIFGYNSMNDKSLDIFLRLFWLNCFFLDSSLCSTHRIFYAVRFENASIVLPNRRFPIIDLITKQFLFTFTGKTLEKSWFAHFTQPRQTNT